MLKPSTDKRKARIPRSVRRDRGLWHDGRNYSQSIGCTGCPEHQICGGLSIAKPLLDCLDHCCGNEAKCDYVCRHKPLDFARRVREISGFSLDNVPRAEVIPEKSVLPSVIPIVFHGDRRLESFFAKAIAVPFNGIVPRRGGKDGFENPAPLRVRFLLSESASLIVTGIENDRPLEKWWSLGKRRLDVIAWLRDMGVVLTTTPNYSLFTDSPRWDDLHSMKRIALTHEEFLRLGMLAALHVNARTEQDWDRWTQYVISRSEVTHIAFEFGTGGGRIPRIDWQLNRLMGLSRDVGRQLHLVVRSAKKETISRLLPAFKSVTALESNAFMKTVNRQIASLEETGRVKWAKFPTETDQPLDALLAHNWNVIDRSYDALFGRVRERTATDERQQEEA